MILTNEPNKLTIILTKSVNLWVSEVGVVQATLADGQLFYQAENIEGTKAW